MWCLKVYIYFLNSGSNNSLAQLTSWSRLLNLNLSSNIFWSSFSFRYSAFSFFQATASRNGAFSKIMNQGKGNPQHLLGISPKQNLSRNIRVCPMIQGDNGNSSLEESSMRFLEIHGPGHIPVVLSMEFWSRHQHCPLCFLKSVVPSLVSIWMSKRNPYWTSVNLSFEGCHFLIIMLTHTEPSGTQCSGGKELPVSSIKTLFPDFLS